MQHTLIIPNDSRIYLIRKWFILAITSLAIAGLFSLPPAILRGTFFKNILDVQHIFDVSLVIHVNLSVLVWIITITSMLWNFLVDNKFISYSKTMFYLASIGTLLMALSVFIAKSTVIKSNYIPMLINFPFIMGLSLLACSVLLTSLFFVYASFRQINSPISIGLYTSALICIVSFLCFFISANKLTPTETIDPNNFYELLFWGGGHILQFLFTNVLAISWIWLANSIGIRIRCSNKLISALFIINLIFVIPMPIICLFFSDVTSTINIFTTHMQIFAGIIPTIICIIIIYSWLTNKQTTQNSIHYLKATLAFSIIFFIYGGFLGFLIKGMNTIVPAHYHASVVGGLSIALMGICYYLKPLIGFNDIKPKLANCQPYIYSIGHLLHITGLAVMGGYGALRKMAGDDQSIHSSLGKIMFFSGAPLALLGGILFIITIALSAQKSPK